MPWRSASSPGGRPRSIGRSPGWSWRSSSGSRSSATHIEFLANIALFVPLGLLLALTLPSRLRYLVLPIGITATVFIEGLQALLLPGRSWSLYDIVANTAGACVGLILAALVNERGDSGSQQP